ncbi:hypothetical protein REH65_09640 [Saccharopolyspora sp. ID03-671]|uniref:hypothetical protein n=1 Tax=Saccharopolyspora sp. ID03-671 TaxID=3073066 RepID=UPI00324848BC
MRSATSVPSALTEPPVTRTEPIDPSIGPPGVLVARNDTVPTRSIGTVASGSSGCAGR